eukprot:scaffold27576_cov75-Phaeocystis_antarctica.AAC.2
MMLRGTQSRRVGSWALQLGAVAAGLSNSARPRMKRPQTFRATTLGSVLPARAAGPLRGQRADYWACGCWACSCGRAAARRAAAYRGSPRRAFAPREAEVCVSPLLALAVPLQMDIARGHRRAALQRASSASQSSATAGCSGRSARQAAARPHCVLRPPARSPSSSSAGSVAARRRAARRAALPAARACRGLRRQRRDLPRRLAGDPADEAARAATARRRGHHAAARHARHEPAAAAAGGGLSGAQARLPAAAQPRAPHRTSRCSVEALARSEAHTGGARRVKRVINTRLRVSIVMLRNVYGSVWRLVDDKSVVTRSRALAPSPPESDRRAGGSDV